MEDPTDLELKFDGEPVRRLDGAPADAVISSLAALQRMVLIIGMRSEGYALGQRFKPSARIKREYSVVCRAPGKGLASARGEWPSDHRSTRFTPTFRVQG